MADEEIDVSKPKEPPKPVHIGGESLADRIIPHLKKIIVSIIVIAVILSIVFGIRAWKQSKQADETAKIAKVLQLAQRKVAPPGTPDDQKKDMFADPKARASAVLDEIAKQGTDLGSAFRGGLLLDAGKVDEAITEYRKGATAEGIDGVLAREGLGIALETKALAEKDAGARQKLLEEALAEFTKMQPEKTGPRRAYALYHQGRIQQVLGKTTEAKALFEQAKEESTEIGPLIEKRLASLGAS
jgi:tetratricopeptide (TPR) repeat protein